MPFVEDKNTQDVVISIDVEQLKDIAERAKRSKKVKAGTAPDVESTRSTVFSVGKDPQVGVRKQISSPVIRTLELLQDGLDNPYVQINWRVARFDVDAGGVRGFNVYRRRLTEVEEEAARLDWRVDERTFDKLATERLAKKNTRRGKFAENQKILPYVKRDAVQAKVLNPMLFEQQQASISSYNADPLKLDVPFVKAKVEQAWAQWIPVKLGFVSYSKFLATEKKKFVQVKEREFVDLSFNDKTVGYGDFYEYFVVAVDNEAEEGPTSGKAKIYIEDATAVRSPVSFRVKQVDETKIQLAVTADPRDNVKKIILYRREENETSFRRLITLLNVGDTADIVDQSVKYGKSYFYRVFLENVHGILSPPAEAAVTSTVQKITPQSRSNNLKIPIISAVQDQSSNYIRFTISPNDPKVSFYEVERKDLSINEQKFTVPSRENTNYGGEGWKSNRFFVRNVPQIAERKLKQQFTLPRDPNKFQTRELLTTRRVGEEITFLDNTTEIGHIYEYRVRGYDLFYNPTSYAFVTTRVVGKKTVRTPINLKSETLRGFPYRVKIAWSDDNFAQNPDAQELFGLKKVASAEKIAKLKQQPEIKGLIKASTEPFSLSLASDFSPAAIVGSQLQTVAFLEAPEEFTYIETQDGLYSIKKSELKTKYIYKIQRRKRGERVYETFPLTANKFFIDEVATTDAIDFSGEQSADIVPASINISASGDDSVVVAGAELRRPFATPDFLKENEIYYYRIAAMDPNGEESNFTKEFEVSTLPDLSDEENFFARIPSSFVRPLIARLSWELQPDKARPDHWVIERKVDVATDSFKTVGLVYLKPEFYDRDVSAGNTYVYRIKAVDVIGRETEFIETRLTL